MEHWFMSVLRIIVTVANAIIECVDLWQSARAAAA